MSICLRHGSSPDCCPNGAFAGFQKTQIGKGGGKALSDTDWHWICTPAPPLVLLGFCDFDQNHAAVQRACSVIFLSQEPARVPVARAPRPVKQGIWAR
ncbi:MAG: hypothetical protein Q8Q26_17265 [Pseudorhodobacter sp.]|nr:hypothetical protein [Pseudorhodobacter sp.]